MCESCALSRVRTSVCQVVSGRVVFGVVIGKIVGAFVPIEAELALGFSTSEPMDSHANNLDAACDDSVIYESDCSQIVCLDGQLGLWSTHFSKCVADGDHVACGDVQNCQLRFCRTGHDKFDDLRDGEDGSVDSRYGFVFG